MRIRLAANHECRLLPEIEASAGKAFADIGMHDVAGEAAPPADAWEPHCASQTLWVAVDEADRPFGFLAAGVHPDLLFIYELAVAHDHQRQGAGRALLAAAEAGARALGLPAVYLTTFCDVAFNGPYYAGLGYEAVADADLPSALRPVMDAERRRWVEPDRRRCAMRKRV
jgi:N-acetylglutamate synthase-like GNAT family acetyltransferase